MEGVVVMMVELFRKSSYSPVPCGYCHRELCTLYGDKDSGQIHILIS